MKGSATRNSRGCGTSHSARSRLKSDQPCIASGLFWISDTWRDGPNGNTEEPPRRKCLVGCGGSTGDIYDIDVLLFGEDIKTNPIRANPSSPGGTLGCQADNIASEGVLLH